MASFHTRPRKSSEVLIRPFVAILLLVLLSTCILAGTRFDFDGDSRADLSVFRSSNGWWYFQNSSNGFQAYPFGQDGDRPVAHDYDGDAKTDAAVFRQGIWYRLTSSTNTFYAVSWGVSDDVPVPADFDADGRADMAVFRPTTAQWFIISSQSAGISVRSFGAAGDVPVPADYDGDQLADIAVFRPSNGTWYRLNSANGGSYVVRAFGQTGDIPLTGDFDGDGMNDLAVWRPSNCNWYLQTSGNSYSVVNFGVPTDCPVPADYDGDGRTDIAVYRPSNGNWYRINSATQTYQVQNFGVESDIPASSPGSPQATPVPTPTPTPTPSPTPAPSPSPSATPTPAPAPFSCDYYAAPTGASTNVGSAASPWDLQTALSKTLLVTGGKTLCLRGGTYVGKFRSTLMGGTVRSAPGEWAKIDGNAYTTLVSSIGPEDRALTVTDGRLLYIVTDEMTIGSEIMKFGKKTGNTITGFIRAASGSLSGSQSHAAGAKVRAVGHQLFITGSNTIYRDFEITNSSEDRFELTHVEQGRGNGVVIAGSASGNSLINLYIHNNSQGVLTSGGTSNTLIYGNIVFQNGVLKVGSMGKGHGLYLESGGGYSRIFENIVLNNFGLNGKGYGTAVTYVGGHIRGSIFANAGSPTATRNRNFIYGPEEISSPTAVIEQSHFYHQSGVGATNFHMGYGAGVVESRVTDNYFSGGQTAFDVLDGTSSMIFERNTFFSAESATSERYVIARKLSFSWNNNTYYNAGANRYRFNPPNLPNAQNFGVWSSNTGYDSTGTAISSSMPDRAIVRANAYETGRANVIIYVQSNATSIGIDLSQAGLSHGQRYYVKNAFSYSASPVMTGIYDQNAPIVNFPLNLGFSVAVPRGIASAPQTTCPRFCSLIILPNNL